MIQCSHVEQIQGGGKGQPGHILPGYFSNKYKINNSGHFHTVISYICDDK